MLHGDFSRFAFAFSGQSAWARKGEANAPREAVGPLLNNGSSQGEPKPHAQYGITVPPIAYMARTGSSGGRRLEARGMAIAIAKVININPRSEN